MAITALIGVLVAVAIVNARVSDAARQETRAALTDRVAAVGAAVDDQQSRVDQQSATVDALQRDLLAATQSQDDAARAERLAAQAGATAVAGPGIVVTIDDAPDAEAGSLNRVLDRDLQDIVNSLWRTGATGIAVNDQRLVGDTAIRGAGEAILVNYQPLTRPYRVSAVGVREADAGLTALLDSLTTDYGLVTEVEPGDVALPAGQVRSPRFATTSQEGAAP